MTRAVLAALISYWARNPLQLFALLGGLTLATALWSGVQAINAEARASYDVAADTVGVGSFTRIERTDGGAVGLATYVALRRAGWDVSPVIEGEVNGLRILGIEPLTAPKGLVPASPSVGGAVGSLRRAVVGQPAALAQFTPLPNVQRVADAGLPPATVLMDISVAARLFNVDDRVDWLFVGSHSALRRVPLADVDPMLTIRQSAPDGADLARMTDSFHLNLTAFGLLAFAVGIFIVHAAIGLAFEQRRAMVRTLRALGVPLGRLLWVMALEVAVLALGGGLAGIVIGYGIAAALLPDVAATLRGLYGAEVAGVLHLRPVWWISGLGMSLGGAASAAAGALWRMAHTPVLAAARPRAWAMQATRSVYLQGVVAAGLTAVALAIAHWGDGLVAGFALLAAMLLGAALALPTFLLTMLRLGQAGARSPVAHWFWADSRQQMPGLSLALMALLLALATNVGVSTMVSSFRLTFVAFLDQRLAAELYVDTAGTEGLEAWLTPRVDAVLPVRSVETTVAGVATSLYGPRDHATYRDNWVFLQARADAWDQMHRGTGVMINEQLARQAGLALDDEVAVEGRPLPVVAIYGDYGNVTGQAMIGAALWQDLFPGQPTRRFGLRLAPDRVPDLRAALIATFGLHPDAVIDQASLKALSLGIFSRTFAVTGALNLLTLAVAGFAILMSLLTLAALRLPQLAPVWALGLTRRALGRIELLRAVLLAGLTMLCALPLGLALAWVLLSVVNVEAFGWRLPLYLFPRDYVILGAEALLAAGLAAAWPSWRLARTPPAALLSVFANVR